MKKMTKEFLEYRINEIKNSNITEKTKNCLIKMFEEIFIKENSDINDHNYIRECKCNSASHLANIPEWLCKILGIHKEKDYKCSTSTNTIYIISIPTILISEYYSLSNELKNIETKEKQISEYEKKCTSTAKRNSIDKLKKLKEELETELQETKNKLDIVTKAIDIKEETENKSFQKTYKKNN